MNNAFANTGYAGVTDKVIARNDSWHALLHGAEGEVTCNNGPGQGASALQFIGTFARDLE